LKGEVDSSNGNWTFTYQIEVRHLVNVVVDMYSVDCILPGENQSLHFNRLAHTSLKSSHLPYPGQQTWELLKSHTDVKFAEI
jgi:hypothetical protein